MACCRNAWSKIVSTIIVVTCSSYAAILIWILVGNDDLLSEARKYVNKEEKLKILIYCSIVFNILWVLSSIILPIFLTITENQNYSIKATQKLIKMYFVWIIFGFLTFIPDVVSTIMHAINLIDTKSSTVQEGPGLMILITSRFVILIILWVSIIVTTTSLQKSLSRNGLVQQFQHHLPQNGQFQNPLPQNGQFQNPMQQNGQFQNPMQQNGQFQNPMQQNGQFQNPMQQNGQFHNPMQQNGQFQNHMQQNGQFQNPMQQNGQFKNSGPQVGNIVPLKPPKPVLKPSKVPYLEENNADRVRDWYKHYENDNNNMNNNSSNYKNNPDIIPKYIPRLNGNTNPAFVDNHTYEPIEPPSQQMSNPIPRHHMPGSNTNVMVNGVTSGTLRRQLPWSYMPNGGELPQRQQRKPQAPAPPSDASSYSNYAPYVPPPDYAGTPNKIQRQEFNNPKWNQYL